MKVDIHASAVIFNNYRILLVRRSLTAKQYPGRWDLPGGSLEVTELTLEDVVRRVVHEQVGLRILPEVIIDNNREGALLDVVFSARLVDDMMSTPLLSPSYVEYQWVSREEAETLSLTPHTKHRLKEMFDYMHYMRSGAPAKKIA